MAKEVSIGPVKAPLEKSCRWLDCPDYLSCLERSAGWPSFSCHYCSKALQAWDKGSEKFSATAFLAADQDEEEVRVIRPYFSRPLLLSAGTKILDQVDNNQADNDFDPRRFLVLVGGEEFGLFEEKQRACNLAQSLANLFGKAFVQDTTTREIIASCEPHQSQLASGQI